MQKTFGLFLLGMLFSSQIFSQTWVRMQSWGLDFESISWVDENLGFVVGENLIARTSDGGTTWDELSVSVQGKLLDVVFIDENTGVAVGENGLILHTQDSGDTWVQRNAGTTSSLKSIAISSADRILVTSEIGEILLSINQGETWTMLNSGVTQALNDISFFNADTAFIAGDEGLILRTYDAGDQWTMLNSELSSNLHGIVFSSPLIGYAVGEGGSVVKTVDAGETWTLQNSQVTVDLRKVIFNPLDIRIITVVGDAATALRSTDSGLSFSMANLGSTNTRNLKALTYNSLGDIVYAVGQDGYLISSTNFGRNFTQQLAGIKNNFTGIDFKSENAGHLTGEKGADYQTSNGAASMTYRPLPEAVDIVGMDFWSSSYGYVGAAAGKMFRTSNNGSSWVSVPAETSETITGFYLFAPSVIYITGTNGYIARSFDSGGTWDASGIQTNTTENLRDITYFDYQVGFAMGDNGQVSWTNGGNVWENLPKLTSEDLNSLAKLDSNTAMIVGDAGVILKSVDMARTWEKIDVPFTENLTSVDFWDENLGFISGDNGLIIQTKDGGESWVKIPTGTSRNITGISVGTTTVAYAVGDDGTILRYECFPPIDLSEIAGESELCLTAATYSIPDAEIPGAQLIWRVDGGEIISGQGTTQIEVLWKTPGRNGVYVSMENFCGNGKTSSMAVNVSDIPSLAAQIDGNGAVCFNDMMIYTVPMLEGVSYKWEAVGGELIEGQGTAEIEVKWITAGLQELSVIIENTCGELAPIIKPIMVNNPPAHPGLIQGDIQTGLWETSYEVEAQDAVNFKWAISGEGGIILQGQGTEKIVVGWEKEGDFQITVTPENECNDGETSLLDVNVNVITAIPEEEDLTLRIYPNPSSGTVNLYLGDANYTSVKVINTFGQIIQSVNLMNGIQEVSLEYLPKGINIIQLYTQSGVVIKKVIVN